VTVETALRAAAAGFGEPAGPEVPVELRWGPLFVALAEGGQAEEELEGGQTYLEAIELIYEGYLFHYRKSRVSVLPAGDRETALLAGDVLYARGLRMIAARGDVASVALLTRLMAACSDLRSVAAPFGADDALWAYTMAAMAATADGVPLQRGEEFFAGLDERLGRGTIAGVPESAAEAAAGLGLAGEAPLEAAFAGILEETRRGTAGAEPTTN
jgi:hypothetical protein